MSLYAYHIEVAGWPTDDGLPWARFYGNGAAAPNHEIPEWLTPIVESALPLVGWRIGDKSTRGRVAGRIRYNDDQVKFVGVLMPLPKRVNYLSASGVSELAADMRAFGAEVVVHRSEPIVWPER